MSLLLHFIKSIILMVTFIHTMENNDKGSLSQDSISMCFAIKLEYYILMMQETFNRRANATIYVFINPLSYTNSKHENFKISVQYLSSLPSFGLSVRWLLGNKSSDSSKLVSEPYEYETLSTGPLRLRLVVLVSLIFVLLDKVIQIINDAR